MSTLSQVTNLILYVLYLVLLIRLIYKRKFLGHNIGYFIAAISIILITEVTSFLYLISGRMVTVSILVIGIVGVVYFLFLNYFHTLTQNILLKKIQFILIIIHGMNFLISAVLIEDFFNSFPDVTNFISIILLLLTISIFLYDVMNSDRLLYFKTYYPFWISFGLLFIYVGIIPLLYFAKRISLPSEIMIYRITLFTINSIGYTLLIIGTYYSKQNKYIQDES